VQMDRLHHRGFECSRPLQYVQVWILLRSVQLSAEPDRLVWRWMTNGQYTSNSCYNALFEGVLVSSS
jgi:hypothetical protein